MYPRKIVFMAALLCGFSGRAICQEENPVPADAAEQGSNDGSHATFNLVDTPPTFPGGEEELYWFLAQEIHYPKKARERRDQGVVYVQFLVKEDGSISEVSVLQGASGYLNAEAIRVVEAMPRWNPAYQRGKPVRVYYKLPIRFSLKANEGGEE